MNLKKVREVQKPILSFHILTVKLITLTAIDDGTEGGSDQQFFSRCIAFCNQTLSPFPYTTVIEALTPLNRVSRIHMCRNNAQSRLCYRMSEMSIEVCEYFISLSEA